ncbi:MAG: ECF-type sigma factor [Planctomycetota bacterium]|nr:ECF-type sigma factor [Planctomycetota bacterium]
MASRTSDTQPDSTDELLPLVYRELRALAEVALRRERADHTLQPTALAHEAYLRLARSGDIQWNGRGHFLATAARVIRHVLVNHAIERKTRRRGDGAKRVPLDESLEGTHIEAVDLLVLDTGLEDLAQVDERAARVVELRFFGGMTQQEIADSLGVSRRTVDNDWAFARAWLRRRVEQDGD